MNCIILFVFVPIMNFLNFLTAGASLFNFNLQNLTSSSAFQAPANHHNPIVDAKINSLSQQEALKIKHEMELLTQKQQLINQYMHLNIQILNQKLENLQKTPTQEKPKIPASNQQVSSNNNSGSEVGNQDQESEEIKNNRKKNKKINKCGHDDKQHYAKGLCNNCYHKFGRNKKPWKCNHEKLYAAGMCQNCYINNYNRKKRLTKDSNNELSNFLQGDIKIEENEQQSLNNQVENIQKQKQVQEDK